MKRQHTIWLSDRVINHFKRRAKQPDAPKYQTQISMELEKIVDRDQAKAKRRKGVKR